MTLWKSTDIRKSLRKTGQEAGMKLGELIYQWFIKDKELAGRLAAFSGEPAVFYQAAPADNQEGWKGGQYPRIVYAVDMQANQGRRSAGAMSVIILCDEAGTLP